MPPHPFPTCRVCGDRIGMYEPAVVVERDTEQETSLTNEPHLADAPGGALAHATCVATLRNRQGNQRAA